MLIKIGRSFVGRTVLIIAALISIMAALLFLLQSVCHAGGPGEGV